MNLPAPPVNPPETSSTPEKPFGRRELLSAAVLSLALLWINLYVCRDLFFGQTAAMNSMHGFWAAIARLADGGWWQSNWWPYWDCGIPFEFTYAPLVPMLSALVSAARHVSPGLAFQSVTLFAYCLTPLTLFLMAWLLTRTLVYSFFAALFYSLTAPTGILVPDEAFHWRNFRDARRLFLMTSWDDTPHVLALAFLPLAILFLSLSIRKRRPVYYAAASISIAGATLASAFGPSIVAMAAVCLLFVVRRREYLRNILITGAIGLYAYALSAPFLPPTLIRAIHTASARGETGNWSFGSLIALTIVALGWFLLWRYLSRWTSDWRLQFFVLFAYLTSSVPMLAAFLHIQFLPQPTRYKLEMELALAPFVVFGARYWIAKMPRWPQAALLFLCLALAGVQIVSYRKYARAVLRPGNLENTIEYRAATWAEQNLPGVRILMPGSIAQWTNTFTEMQQFTGGSWSIAYNYIQQRGFDAAFHGAARPELDARVSLAWLKAYGVGALCVPGPQSAEYWKPFSHPLKFEGVLPALWHADDTTIYQIPQRTKSFAHLVPESAVIRNVPIEPGDLTEIDRYDAALEDSALPAAEFQWIGRNRIHIHTVARPGEVLSVQVSYHPGWHATDGTRTLAVKKDGLGLMWLRPECNGPCDVELDYDGGWELRICRFISIAAITGLLLGLPLWGFRRRVAR